MGNFKDFTFLSLGFPAGQISKISLPMGKFLFFFFLPWEILGGNFGVSKIALSHGKFKDFNFFLTWVFGRVRIQRFHFPWEKFKDFTFFLPCEKKNFKDFTRGLWLALGDGGEGE